MDNPKLHLKDPKDSIRKFMDLDIFPIVFLKIELVCDLASQLMGIRQLMAISQKYSVNIAQKYLYNHIYCNVHQKKERKQKKKKGTA